MTTEPSNKPRGRWQLLLLASVFFGPLIVASWLYYGGDSMQPEGRANAGALLEPITHIPDVLPESSLLAGAEGRWLLVYSNLESCGEECRDALYTIRQSRLMLGREMDRILRIFLHGETPPDTIFLAEEHEGLVTLADAQMSALLADKRPAELAAGGYYLVDPHGNLVMYFHPDMDPGEMVDDIKRLLRLSRIG